MTEEGTLKVLMRPGEHYGASYSHSGYMFAYCSKIENGKVYQRSGFHTCREDLSGCLFDNRSNSKNGIPTDRSRYIIRHVMSSGNVGKIEKWFNGQTKTSLKIVNIMEARHHWPLTKMYDGGTQTRKLDNHGYNGDPQQLTTFQKVIIGSSKWVRSPHMVSLYALLFRLPTRIKSFDSIKDYEDLKKACITCKGITAGDGLHVSITFKFWDMLMANFPRMFAGTTSKDNFKKASYGNNQYDEGISKLCRFNCNNKNISKKFVALAKGVGLFD